MDKTLILDKIKNDTDYQTFFKSAMKKFGVTSITSMEDDKKKEFFDYVDNNYKAKNESRIQEANSMQMTQPIRDLLKKLFPKSKVNNVFLNTKQNTLHITVSNRGEAEVLLENVTFQKLLKALGFGIKKVTFKDYNDSHYGKATTISFAK